MQLDDINSFLQKKLKKEKLEKVQAVEAAKWFDEEGLLKDDPGRSGRILRKYPGEDILGPAKKKPLVHLSCPACPEKGFPQNRVKGKEHNN
ncbi:MAG: hypothetical protein SVV67_10000 [Bacillota bacterium]|nr:hypothetical protein [Bacillota bacterium]